MIGTRHIKKNDMVTMIQLMEATRDKILMGFELLRVSGSGEKQIHIKRGNFQYRFYHDELSDNLRYDLVIISDQTTTEEKHNAIRRIVSSAKAYYNCYDDAITVLLPYRQAREERTR